MSGPHGALTPAASLEATAMFAIRRILCPVDFSEESRRGLEHAVAIARRWGARLEVLHVYQAASPFDVVAPDDETAVTDPQLDMLRTATFPAIGCTKFSSAVRSMSSGGSVTAVSSSGATTSNGDAA